MAQTSRNHVGGALANMGGCDMLQAPHFSLDVGTMAARNAFLIGKLVPRSVLFCLEWCP